MTVFGRSGCAWACVLWAGVAAAVLPTGTAEALTWEQRSVTVLADPLLGEARARYAFTNAQDHAVTITAIRSSCGCTVPALEKRTYEPGEQGEIVTTFRIGNRKGVQVKKLVVRTDDPDHPVATLTLKAEIRRVVDLDPAQLVWSAGASDPPREVEVVWIDEQLRPDTSAGAVSSRAGGLAVDLRTLAPDQGSAAEAGPAKQKLVLSLAPEPGTSGAADVIFSLQTPDGQPATQQFSIPVQLNRGD